MDNLINIHTPMKKPKTVMKRKINTIMNLQIKPIQKMEVLIKERIELRVSLNKAKMS